MERTLVHINGDVTCGTFLFICHENGWAKVRNGRGLQLVSFVSFRGEIDRTAVTRMSGRHWMNLIN